MNRIEDMTAGEMRLHNLGCMLSRVEHALAEMKKERDGLIVQRDEAEARLKITGPAATALYQESQRLMRQMLEVQETLTAREVVA